MKKLFLNLFVLGVFAFSSCGDSEKEEKGSSASEIKVSEINSACGCVEAWNLVLKEGVEKLEGKKKSELSPEENDAFKEKTKHLKDKFEEIYKHCDKKFPGLKIEELKDCAAVEEYNNLLNQSR